MIEGPESFVSGVPLPPKGSGRANGKFSSPLIRFECRISYMNVTYPVV